MPIWFAAALPWILGIGGTAGVAGGTWYAFSEASNAVGSAVDVSLSASAGGAPLSMIFRQADKMILDSGANRFLANTRYMVPLIAATVGLALDITVPGLGSLFNLALASMVITTAMDAWLGPPKRDETIGIQPEAMAPA